MARSDSDAQRTAETRSSVSAGRKIRRGRRSSMPLNSARALSYRRWSGAMTGPRVRAVSDRSSASMVMASNLSYARRILDTPFVMVKPRSGVLAQGDLTRCPVRHHDRPLKDDLLRGAGGFSPVNQTASVRIDLPSGSGNRGARIHTSCAVVAAPTLDRAFARWCFTVECDRPRRWAAAFSEPATRTAATTTTSRSVAHPAGRSSCQPPRRGQPLIAALDRDGVG